MLHPRFSPSSHAAFKRARELAAKNRSEVVGTAHLLLALLEEKAAAEDEPEFDHFASLLVLSGVKRDEVRLYTEAALGVGETDALSADFHSRELLHVLRWARAHTYEEIIEPEHLLVALTQPQQGPHIGEIIRPLGLQPAKLDALLRQIERDARHKNRPLRMLEKRARAALQAAHEAARASFCGRVSSLHLLLGLLDTASPIRTHLRKEGVDMNALRAIAIRAQSNDGIIGGPQMRLSPDAKRALERAKAWVMRNQSQQSEKRIAPEHLWLALLSGQASWRQKLRWGSELEDSLEVVWKQFDRAPLEFALRTYLQEQTHAPSALQWMNKPLFSAPPEKINKIHLDAPFVAAGAAWCLWFFMGLEAGLFSLVIGTLTGLIVMIVGESMRSRALRDRAASWLCGLIIGIFLSWFVAASIA